MKLQNNQNSQYASFSGYDARKLKGIVMNSNYAGIANQMKQIGDLENFKIYLFENGGKKIALKTDEFEMSAHSRGCWAQDMWGVVKNTLLTCEPSNKAEILKKIFSLVPNFTQNTLRSKSDLDKLRMYLHGIDNLPYKVHDGKLKVEVEKGLFVDAKLYSAEVKTKKTLYNNLCRESHVKGGNYFLTKNKDGEEELLIGQNELRLFDIDTLKKMFQLEKVHVIPQADYHLDLFIRPLNDKKVLIADDEMMLKTLQCGYEKSCDLMNNLSDDKKHLITDAVCNLGMLLDNFKNILKNNPYANMQKVEEALVNAEYQPIKVPGRIFELENDYNMVGAKAYLKHLHNYMNSHVHINDKDEIIYITNNSTLDDEIGLCSEVQKLSGFSLKKSFWEAVKPHVSKVYFVSGKNNAVSNMLLREQLGGIHCMGAEVPW